MKKIFLSKVIASMLSLALVIGVFSSMPLQAKAEENCLHQLGAEGYEASFTPNADGETHTITWSCSKCNGSGTEDLICYFNNNVCICGQTRNENSPCSHTECNSPAGNFATCNACSSSSITYEFIDENNHKAIERCYGCPRVTESTKSHEYHAGVCPCGYGTPSTNPDDYHSFIIMYNEDHKIDGSMNKPFEIYNNGLVTVITRQMVDSMVQNNICVDSSCSIVGIYTDSTCSTEFSSCNVVIGESTTVYLKFNCNHKSSSESGNEEPKHEEPVYKAPTAEEIAEAISQAVEEKIKAEEAIPVTDFVSTEAVNAIPTEVKENTSTEAVFNLSKITTTRGFVAAVDKIVKVNPEDKTVTFYSAYPFAFNTDSLLALTNANKDFVYMFKHDGQLYKITIPAGAKVDLAGQTFAGPLYIGAQLGTTVVVK